MESPIKQVPNGDVASTKKEEIIKVGFFDAVITPPDWLTEAYVEDALRKNKGDPKLKITNYSVTTCTKPGDNFVGVMFRAKVSYESCGKEATESLIMKIEPFLDGPKKDMMNNSPLFRTEGRIYTEVLPIMEDLLKNIKDPEIIAPKLIHYASKPEILIFQDIAPDGFVMQHLPVPLDKAALVAKKLGKFHALSYYMIEERGDAFLSTFQDGLFAENGMAVEWDFVDMGHKVLCDVVKGWGLEAIAEKLTAMTPHITKLLVDAYKPKPKGQGINVLNHGDLHIRNLLFRYDDPTTKAKFEEIRFIDYQITTYGTPAIDLAYLVFMIADYECYEMHRDRLLREYYDEFAGTLTNLGFLGKIPSLIDFHVEVMKNGILELFVATNFLSLFYMKIEENGGVDFTDPEQVPEFTRQTLEHPDYKELLMSVLPKFLNRGILDL